MDLHLRVIEEILAGDYSLYRTWEDSVPYSAKKPMNQVFLAFISDKKGVYPIKYSFVIEKDSDKLPKFYEKLNKLIK